MNKRGRILNSELELLLSSVTLPGARQTRWPAMLPSTYLRYLEVQQHTRRLDALLTRSLYPAVPADNFPNRPRV